jgi:hypothetical protein
MKPNIDRFHYGGRTYRSPRYSYEFKKQYGVESMNEVFLKLARNIE